MKVISNNISTLHRQIIFNRIINVIAILGFIEKLKHFFENGYWLEAKNVTKNGPKTFIKQLNKCTSYHQNERNHTFTHALYIPEGKIGAPFGTPICGFVDVQRITPARERRRGRCRHRRRTLRTYRG